MVLVITLYAAGSLSAQLSVSSAAAATMVNELVAGDGTVEINPASISFTGGNNMRGLFDGANSNIGFQKGVIMSTGSIDNALGPNDDNGYNGGGNFELAGNSLLNSLTNGTQTFDAATLRFQFRILGDYIKFRYVFASEEYNEFVCSPFNDAFAFFISGPGISGMENLALVPGTNTPVSINTINNGNVGASGSVNNNPCILSNSSLFRPNNQNSVQFDGFTKPLVAERGGLSSCVWYTLTLVIADVSDSEYDSAVFLESGSLTSNAPAFTPGAISLIDGVNTFTAGVTDMNENCGSMLLKISVGNQPLPAAVTFPLTIGGTATPSVDYQALPSSLTIPAGAFQTDIPITVLSDATIEGPETIVITYSQSTCSGPVNVTQTFTILDPAPPISITTTGPFDYRCPRIKTNLKATISGGRPPYSYQWTGFEEQDNPVDVYPKQTTTYTFNLVDACGTPATASTQVNIPGYVPLRINTQTNHVICKGDTVTIGSPAVGGRVPIAYDWQPISDLSPAVIVQPEETTVYRLFATDSCMVRISKEISVRVNVVKALFDVTYLDQREVQFNDLSYNNILTWDWDFDFQGSSSIEQNPRIAFPDTGFYTVELKVTDANNCRDSVSNPIYAYPPYTLFIPNAFTPDGDGINDVFEGIGEGYVDYEMWIYNRWGEQIYYTDSDSDGWGSRGRYSLEDLQSGVYAYRIVTRRPTLDKNEYVGKVVVFE